MKSYAAPSGRVSALIHYYGLDYCLSCFNRTVLYPLLLGTWYYRQYTTRDAMIASCGSGILLLYCIARFAIQKGEVGESSASQGQICSILICSATCARDHSYNKAD